MKVLPPPFRYSLGNYIYFFYIHFSELKLIARSVPVLKLPEKSIIPSSRSTDYYMLLRNREYLQKI